MPPVPNKANMDDSESQFDFLNVDENPSGSDPAGNGERDDQARRSPDHASRSARSAAADKPFPVIRKPVCVTQTGALRRPQPGDPVEPPPPLTDGVRVAPTPVKRPDRAEIDFSDLDDLGLDKDDWPASDQWVDTTQRSEPRRFEQPETSLLRKSGYGLAGLLIVTGAVTALYSVPSVKEWTDNTMSGLVGTLPDSENVASTEIAQNANTPSAVNENAPKSLNTLFREELDTLETLLAQGSLDEVEQRLQTMDRAVFGYGAPEFTEIKEQLAILEQGGTLDAQSSNTQLAEQQRVTDARELEEQRVTAELERQASAEREAAQAAEALAAEQQRAVAESEALALQQAQQEKEAAEAQRLALQQAEQEKAAADAERLAVQQAEEQRVAEAAQEEARQIAQQRAERERQAAAQAQVQADRIAQEQARQEQLQIATQERTVLEQRLSQQRSAGQEAASAAYQSEEGQGLTPQGQQESIQDLAASQREAARQQRLIDARQRSAQEQSTASAAQSEPEDIVALAEPSLPEPVQQAIPKNITDADLQFVYGQFAQLQSAIEDRNVNAVIRLTERSGVRIQQVMQMFENNVSIQARLRNVSTLDANGEIQGTLQITRLVRADGSVTGPPLNLGSVRLSSVRKGDGWSSIRW